jgi:hypothetical protein
MVASSSVQPPAPPVRTPRIETPPPPRHTVPPPSARLDSDDYQVTRTESLADLRAYEFGCVGLCMGDACLTCTALADQISEARLIHDIDRLRLREAELTQQINALREGRC